MRLLSLVTCPELDKFLVQTIVRVFTMIKILTCMKSNESIEPVLNECLIQMIGGERLRKRTKRGYHALKAVDAPSSRWMFSLNSSKVFHYRNSHCVQPVCLVCVGHVG